MYYKHRNIVIGRETILRKHYTLLTKVQKFDTQVRAEMCWWTKTPTEWTVTTSGTTQKEMIPTTAQCLLTSPYLRARSATYYPDKRRFRMILAGFDVCDPYWYWFSHLQIRSKLTLWLLNSCESLTMYEYAVGISRTMCMILYCLDWMQVASSSTIQRVRAALILYL